MSRNARQVAVIVLAAGASSRFGAPKQGAEVAGMTLAERALRTALDSNTGAVVLVTGAHAETTLGALARLAEAERHRVRIVHNDAWATGQASSVRAGIAALDTETDAAIIMPVDQPYLSAEVLDDLVGAWANGAAIVAPACDGEVRGAPALFDRGFFGELLALEGDTGGRVLLKQYKERVHTIAVSSAQLLDIDFPSDLSEASY